MRDLLTTKEAASLLRLKVQTLAAWRCHGEGPPFYRVGRRVLYDKADLATWVETKRCQ